MPILLPGRVADSIRKDHARNQAEAQRMLDFFRRLRDLDSRFTDVFLAAEDDETYSLRKGFWYLERRDDEGNVSFIESSNEDGSYREPDDRTLEALRFSDTWNRDVWRDITRTREERQRRRDAEKAREREELQGRLREEADFAFRVQVPVTPDGRGRLRTR